MTKKHVSDVARPGKTTASATSRPIIVGHGSSVQDPMVSKSKDVDTTIAQPNRAGKTISPVSEAATEEPPTVATPAPTPGESSAVVDAVLEAATTKKKNETETEVSKKADETAQKLIANKTYFLPINSVARRRNSLIASTLFAFMLLALIGAYLLIDAEIVQTNITLPINLIP